MKKDMILFDLDGTLLPMDQDLFVKIYFQHLTKKVAPFGYEPQSVVDGIWQGTRAMVKNDGRVKNEARFWTVFSSLLGQSVLRLKDEFTSFYQNEFHAAKSTTAPNPLAGKAVRLAREKARRVVLATNPIFPRGGVATRLSWIGLSPDDFDFVTTYENASFCKPNPGYYKEILSLHGARPESCLMVGNDLKDDAFACGQAGIEAFVVTDCLIEHDLSVQEYKSGTFEQMLAFLESL